MYDAHLSWPPGRFELFRQGGCRPPAPPRNLGGPGDQGGPKRAKMRTLGPYGALRCWAQALGPWAQGPGVWPGLGPGPCSCVETTQGFVSRPHKGHGARARARAMGPGPGPGAHGAQGPGAQGPMGPPGPRWGAGAKGPTALARAPWPLCGLDTKPCVVSTQGTPAPRPESLPPGQNPGP